MLKPTQEILHEYLSYDEDTGHLTWIKKPSRKTVISTRAGNSNKSGYRTLTIFGKKYPEHHIVWCYCHGYFPSDQIDHINHIRDDNRISNLREVTKAENARNRTKRDSRVNEVGIWYCKRRKRYIAEITFEGKKVFQRSYECVEKAIQERKLKALELGFHENHGD